MVTIETPKTFSEAHSIIRADWTGQSHVMRTWLDAQGKGGAWAGTIPQILAAIDRYYDCGTIGWVIDRMK